MGLTIVAVLVVLLYFAFNPPVPAVSSGYVSFEVYAESTSKGMPFDEKAYFVRDNFGKEYVVAKDAVVNSMPKNMRLGWKGFMNPGTGVMVDDLNRSRGGTRVRIFALPPPAETGVVKVPLAVKHDHL